MRYRKLRIAWTVFCGIACVLLLVLWVRSYLRLDQVRIPITKSRSLELVLVQSGVSFVVRYNLTQPETWNWFTIGLKEYQSNIFASIKRRGHYNWEGHYIDWGSDSRQGLDEPYILTPYWLLITCVAALAVLPWMRWRFSLRTLLIATTLVAVVLGLIVWTIRR